MDATKAVLRVGDGRGFVVTYGRKQERERAIITAAHCLPMDEDGRLILPPAHGATFSEERTYKSLLGPLGGETTVAAEALFIDPVADLAVLGPPDDPEDWEAYEAMIEPMHALTIGTAPAMERVRELTGGGAIRFGDQDYVAPPSWVDRDMPGKGKGKFLTLAGEWVEIDLVRFRYALSVFPGKLAEAGTSGSPILSPRGKAIAVVALGGENRPIGPNVKDEDVTYHSDGNPVLAECLPARFLKPSPRP